MTLHKYRVREGFTYGVAEYPAGTILELDDSVAIHSMDKLELAEIVGGAPSSSEPISSPSEESGQVGQDPTPKVVSRRSTSRKSGDD